MILLIAGVLILGNIINNANSKNIYNYYELAVQKWCSNDYMIHGLWPQINNSDYPEYCKIVSYIVPSGQLLTNMNMYWNSCNDNLWQHEWEKHGSCMQEQVNIDENTFFNTTVTLFLENIQLLNTCSGDDCIMACFDLNYKLIECK